MKRRPTSHSDGQEIGAAQVVDVRTVASDPRTVFKTVSDHLPIVARFRSAPDDDWSGDGCLESVSETESVMFPRRRKRWIVEPQIAQYRMDVTLHVLVLGSFKLLRRDP